MKSFFCRIMRTHSINLLNFQPTFKELSILCNVYHACQDLDVSQIYVSKSSNWVNGVHWGGKLKFIYKCGIIGLYITMAWWTCEKMAPLRLCKVLNKWESRVIELSQKRIPRTTLRWMVELYYACLPSVQLYRGSAPARYKRGNWLI